MRQKVRGATMLLSDAHHAEAKRCRWLATAITDGEARTLLTHMAQIYDTLAAGAMQRDSGFRPRR